jgi:hypothetical protein
MILPNKIVLCQNELYLVVCKTSRVPSSEHRKRQAPISRLTSIIFFALAGNIYTATLPLNPNTFKIQLLHINCPCPAYLGTGSKMSGVEELPDDFEGPFPDTMPDLPPLLADNHHQTVDEVVKDLKRSPFFMTSLDDAGDEPNPELDAIKALMYEGSRVENAEDFREQGNEFAREKKWKDGKELYSKGLKALKAARRDEDPTGPEEDQKETRSKELLLVNRALCHLELRAPSSPFVDCSMALTDNLFDRELSLMHSGQL